MISRQSVCWTLVVLLVTCGRCNGLRDPFLEDGSAVDIRVRLEVEEEKPIGTVVGFIPVIDAFTYRFSDNSPEFHLNSTTGQISTAVVLDRESMKSDRFDFVILSSQPTYPVEVRITVLDVNDNAPTFPEPSIQVSFAESANAGTRVIIDAAHDRDIGNNSVSGYRIISGNEDKNFQLIVVTNPSGETPYLNLEIVGELDRETQSSYRLNISAQDGGSPPLMGFLIVEVTIIDVNDNPPIFDHSDYVVSVNESVRTGSKILRVHATDIDTENNAKITYYLNDADTQLFVVESDTGVIMTQDKLSCPKNCPSGGKCTKSCVFTVFAHDHGSPRQDGRTYVTVNLLDSNDNDPRIAFRFNPPSAKFGTVDENAQNGTIVAAVSVVDPDDGPSGQTSVRIESGNELRHFRIERNQDVDIIRVNSVLDREKIGKYNLTISASDKGSPPRSSTSHLIIIVNDVNDHEPVFEQSEYFAVLQEMVPIGSFVASILATDEDSGMNSNVIYAIASGNKNNWFRIDKITGLVTTAQFLDREKQSIVTLKISAQDGGPNPKWAFTMLRIEIQDENETPQFPNQWINISVIENQPANTLLISLTANDGDQGTNGTVHYYIAEDTSKLYPNVFTLEPKQGHLRTLKVLDREESDFYTIKILATDLGQPPKSSTATVFLTVLDANDNDPVFYPLNYFVSVEQMAPIGSTVVQLMATDKDAGINGQLVYYSVSDLPEFSVSKNGLVELKSKLSKSEYEFVVGAKDGGDRKTTTDAVVHILVTKKEINVVKLEFTQSGGYFFTIQEDDRTLFDNNPRQVGQISAFSQDYKGIVKYYIISGDPFASFSINEHSGIIQTSRVIDREEKAGYLLLVLARLGNTYGKVRVNITVSDINDNEPLFINKSSRVYVKENSPKGYEFHLAKAEDTDDGVNAEIWYNLTVNSENVFGITQNTGMLYLKGVLDYEKVKEYDVQISAQDGGIPVLMSTMSLKIVVVDVNDHTPVFEHLSYESSLSELTPVNSRFHVLTAKDRDSGANGRVMYRIQEAVSAFGIFPDGYLYVKSSLDREKLDYYELTVVASDMGEPQRSTSVQVAIYILDENDNSPIFNNATFNFTLSENEPPETYVGRLLASDKDIGRNSELTFAISTNQIDFVIDPRNGYIRSTRPFNREELIQTTGHDYLSMQVVVSDNGIIRKRDEAVVFIRILDVNDNPPVFLRQPYKATISETSPINTLIFRVICSDLDEGLNAQISYELVDANSTFTIDKSNGQIVLITPLDREIVPSYTLTVLAHDSGLPSRTSTAHVIVEVLDENDNAPRFENAPESATLPEDTPVGTEVVQFVATDDDDVGVKSETSFSLTSGNLQDTFRIDANSGILYLEKMLDYETIPVYHLSVMATDGGSPRLSSSVEVNIIVSDVNDNAPSLFKMPATRKIREGVSLKAFVLNVTAEDADSGINGQIRYSIAFQEPDGGYFGIDEISGVVYTMRDIDREYSTTFRLRIVATDQALPVSKRLSAEKTLTIFVEDINDNAPIFVSLDSVLVPEDAEKGFVVMTLSATDADAYENGQVSYELLPAFSSDANSAFAVDRSSGNLYLNRRLEKQSIYNVSVRAVDGAMPSRRKTSERTLTVLNLPVNDAKNRLQFERSEYKANVAENETIGTPVVTLGVKGLSDAGANKVRYFVTSLKSNGVNEKRFFNVDTSSGVLSTAAVLDRDQGVEEHVVEVLAVGERNDGKETMTARTKIHITVLDKNDSPPVFDNSSLFYAISEDVPIGHLVAEIRAKDPDTTGLISYRLISNGNGKFKIDPSNGKITVIQPLDRELQSEYELTIEANDGIQYDVRKIHIKITDVNDNAPVFEKQVYSFDLSEDSPRGAKVGQIKATDADEGGNSRVTYSVVSDWGSDVFSLNPDLGVFTLTSLLDYEKVQYYMFVVEAQDSQEPSLSSTVTVYFNVLDVNDNAPIFDPMSYSKEVFENITIGTAVLTVVATDLDDGNNGRIMYSFDTTCKDEPFTISSDGTISTISLLDREEKSFYNLIVIAEDQANTIEKRLSSVVQVNIIVRDVNDNAPEFVTPNITDISENAALNSVVTSVKAIDKDEGRNSYIEYNLIQIGRHESKFVLGPVDGLLRVNGILDRELHSNYSLRIVARDRGTPAMSSLTTITVNVLDENDNTPEFQHQEYSASVSENASIGASIVQLSATDRDEGLNGRLRYSIVAGDRNRNFIVAEDSGMIRLAKQLDYETKNMYILTVQAEDGGNDAKHDTATVTISITDVNDSPPIFLDSPYDVAVMEDVSEFPFSLVTVDAKDFDAPPNNQVRYFIKDGDNNIFTINGTTGEIYVTSPLDREKKSNYEVTVVAMDSGSPRLTGIGFVKITVEDVNDCDPVLDKSNYFATILENSPPNSTVVQVSAKDNDAGLNALISFTLQGDMSSVFDIDSATGIITTRSSLDHELQNKYELLVVAFDSSLTNPRHVTATLTVLVEDLNDNLPFFDEKSYTVFVPDGIAKGHFVFGATARDFDSGDNGHLTYTLAGSDADKFDIDFETGVIKTKQIFSGLDSVYQVEVTAADKGNPSLTATITVEIRLRQYKNFPQFTANLERKFVLPEETSDQLVTTIIATSPKTSPINDVTYRIVGGNIGNVFTINQKSGEIRVNGTVDYESVSTYELWIEAQDSDDPPMSAIQSLIISITDINDNAPTFEQRVYNVSIMEEELPPLAVVTVKALDADGGRNGKFSYRILSDPENGSAFSIDSNSGKISTNSRLDREEMEFHTLFVEAVDEGTPPKTGSATILITLLDKNDNPPRFTRLFSANVTENSKIGTFVVQVTSSDRDSGANQNAVYSFTENPGRKFNIDPVSGNVTVAGSIDREMADEYILKVSAVDGSWRAETPLSITIQDVNDNAPICEKSDYNFIFPEQQRTISFVGRVSATDQDRTGRNSQITYSFKQASDTFELDPSTGDILSKSVFESNSAENQFNLIVVASDHGKPSLSTECPVAIKIVNDNKSAPKFKSKITVAPVSSSAPTGASVSKLDADDKQEIELKIVGGNGTEFFQIEKSTGLITVASPLINNEGKWYQLQVEAKDNGIPPLKSNTTVLIVVTDENIYAPVFNTATYQVIIAENEVVNSSVVVVKATDQDRGVNGKIVYSIIDGNHDQVFDIDQNSGVVKIVKSLDYEVTQEYRLNITAKDGGFLSKSSYTMITVVVTDINDNPPIFSQESYDAFVMENSIPEVSIMSVRATDLDSGRNAVVLYSITSGDGKDVFIIDIQSGAISSKMSLNYEEKSTYFLDILATNPDSVQYTSARVTIHVQGVNEFYPKFVGPTFHFTISETATIGTSIGTVLATDADKGVDGEIDYVLVGSNADKGFSVDSQRGIIRVARNLDSEAQKKITFNIIAKNHGPIRGNDIDQTRVTITIQDGNDPPVFKKSVYQLSVSENVPVGYSVVSVEAQDGDVDPKNKHFTYSIVSGNVGSVFEVNQNTGVIITSKILDRETKSSYNLTVGATDRGIPPQTGMAIVQISIQDVNDNPPFISRNNLVGSVSENRPPGTMVMVLKATDLDSAKNGPPFTYVLSGGADSNFFTVDSTSGTVLTATSFDRERTQKLSFNVDVTDSGKPALKETFLVNVIVADENDCPSSPRNATIIVSGMENIVYKTALANIYPLDPDTTNDYQCSLMNSNDVKALTVKEKCTLHSSALINNTKQILIVNANDGKHASVVSSFHLFFHTFSNISINHFVNIQIANITVNQFTTHKYTIFIETLAQILTSQGYYGGLNGINQNGNTTHLFISALKNSKNIVTKNELIALLKRNIDLLEKTLATQQIIIGYAPCLDAPCLNEGQCEDDILMYNTLSSIDTPELIITTPTMVHEYICKCQTRFKGMRCEEKLDPCTPNPCHKESSCVSKGQDFECNCAANRYGYLCEHERTDVCVCLNGGTCQHLAAAQPFCLCQPGFQGSKCESISGTCLPNPCENGGTCSHLQSGYKCDCQRGFFGPKCEFSSKGFGRMSYMAFPPLPKIVNDITVIFSTFQSSGLIAYTYGIQMGARSDFLALELVNSRMRFSMASARSVNTISVVVNKKIEPGKWYRAAVTLESKVLSLTVTRCHDNGLNCQDCLPGNAKCSREIVVYPGLFDFNNELLYVGGVRTAEAIVERPGQVLTDDFVGCMKSVVINGKDLDLNQPLAFLGISDTCFGISCKGDSCSENSDCSNGLVAMDCSDAFDAFSFNGGTYLELETTELYRRHQLLPQFYHGNKNERSKRYTKMETSQSLSLQFYTLKNNGLVLHAASKAEFTLLEIHEGVIIYTSNSAFDHGINITFPDIMVNDGEWHNLTLIRKNNVMTIQIDSVEKNINASKSHNFLDPYLTKLYIGGTSDSLINRKDTINFFDGCISTLIINGEIQMLDKFGGLFRPMIHGKLLRGCMGPIESQGAPNTDPLSVGVILVIIFFIILMVAILVSCVVYRKRRLNRDKMDSATSHHQNKSNGTALLTTALGEPHWTNGGIENGDVTTEEFLRNHGHEVKKPRDMDLLQRPDIIEREVINKSPAVTSYRTDECALLADSRTNNNNSMLSDLEAPEHYDLENASSIAPSDIDVVYHYKSYRDGNVRHKNNSHILSNFHKHNHHQFQSVANGVARTSPQCRLLNQSPTIRESPSVMKMQTTTPLARLSPSSELSQQTPRILTLHDISGRPLQCALQRVTGVANSERSLNSPVSQLSQSTGSIQSNLQTRQGIVRKDKKISPIHNEAVSIGLTAEEIDRLNTRPRNSSLVSTLDAVSSSSEEVVRNSVVKNKMAELLETNTELLEGQDSSSDESGNDSFTCSEFEYDNYERVVPRCAGGGGGNGADLGRGNMIFSKLAEENEEDDDDEDDDETGSTKNFNGFDSFHGSLSTLVASDDDLSFKLASRSDHVGWHYLLNWGPNFESLVGVFKDIAELPDAASVKTNKCNEEYL